MFLVQPLMGRLVLPWLGGSPEVWNTCMVFFQAVLLAGYGYAHLISKHLKLRNQVVLHAAVLLLPCMQLPLLFSLGVGYDATDSGKGAVLWLIGRLAVSVGLPFFALATTAPLLQRWFATTNHAQAADPYFLYAASNLGSMLALLGYPLLVEPWLPLAAQCLWWSAAYGAFVLLSVASGIWAWRSQQAQTLNKRDETPKGAMDDVNKIATPQPKANAQPKNKRAGQSRMTSPNAQTATSPTWRQRCWWLALSFVPSSWLLGVTTFLTTDIAPVPLLWIGPLAIYLLSFIYAFARRQPVPHGVLVEWYPLALFVLTGSILAHQHGWLLAIHLGAFAWGAFACHGSLAALRPKAQYLTEFYFWISLGGVLGGTFNALFAPFAFPWLLEYPLAPIAAALLLAGASRKLSKSERLWRMLVLAGLMLLLVRARQGTITELPVLLVGVTAAGLVAGAALIALNRRSALAWVLSLPLLLSVVAPPFSGQSLFTARSFFGVHRVLANRDEAGDTYHHLVHGGTIHGRQARSSQRMCEPLTYYHRVGPAGDALTLLSRPAGTRKVGVIGLGSGALACYCDRQSEFTFFEIDPVVQRAAGDPKLFSFLTDCAQGPCRVVLGDGRVRLAAEPDGEFDLLILDAFSSDAVPIHLLTLEAIELYRRKTASSGLLLFHISNRHLDLEQVLSTAAAELGMNGLVRSDQEISPADFIAGRTPATYVALANEAQILEPLARQAGWKPLANPGIRPWRDDYSSILGVLRW